MNTNKNKTVQSKPDGYTLLDTGWISVEEAQPKPQEKVYIVCEKVKYDGSVVRFQTIAEYIPYMTVKEKDYMADEYQGEGDYNEQEDEYYTPEGYYEWQSEPEMHWKILAKVTHWMPLIAFPLKKTLKNNKTTQLETGAVSTRYLSKLSDIKPCPFCGNKLPFSYYNPFIAYLGCDECGINFGSAQVIYKRDELPEELKGLEEEAIGLEIIGKDGTITKYPEHNRVVISCVTAFDHKGILSKWNRRS